MNKPGEQKLAILSSTHRPNLLRNFYLTGRKKEEKCISTLLKKFRYAISEMVDFLITSFFMHLL